MRSNDPLRNGREKPKPKIWSSGDQRPPFNLRAFGRVTLHLSRTGVAPLLAWAARLARRVALNVRNGAGRIPEAKLGRAARFVPSHQRVAAWIKNLGATLAHASATADPDVKQGNALVATIEPHLWPAAETGNEPPAAAPETGGEPQDTTPTPAGAEPVVLAEPSHTAELTGASDNDPLLSIRDELADGNSPRQASTESGPVVPPSPPGPVATAAIQVLGYLIGWAVTCLALPYGLVRTAWLLAKGEDLRRIGQTD